jgi:DNA-binding transcriptional regulator YiaG
MAGKKAGKRATASRLSGNSNQSSRRPPKASLETVDVGHKPELTAVDREIIEALGGFRDALRDRAPLERKYTVRQVFVTVPPPQFGPEDVRKTREALGVSQPVFADVLGTSPSTVRSWEQGQKLPSSMARRLLGLIASDPAYWKSQFLSMGRPRSRKRDVS